MVSGKTERNMAKASTLTQTRMCIPDGGHLVRKMAKALMSMLPQINE